MLTTKFGQESLIQAPVAPVPSPGAGPSRHPLPAWGRPTRLAAIPLALIVIYAFIPILNNGFLPWDDYENFLENLSFRGLGAAQVKWAWSTFLLGVYQPLAWMLFEAQYVFRQLDPFAYHFTSLLLHVANAVVLYVLTVALLVRGRTDSCLESPWTCSMSAGLATALFAVHPLRVEAVAWASSQPYLPCALFSMLSVLAYLRAFRSSSSPRWGWLVGSCLLFVAALLFKAVPMGLPAVLLILDVYPLRRLEDGTGRWFGVSARRILLEKVPFVMVSLVFMGLAIAAKAKPQYQMGHYDVPEGIAQACYRIWFYIEKTVLPLNLTAWYPIPRELNWLALPFSLSILATLATSAGLFLLRRRWPGLLAAWLGYLVILAPNLGFVRFSDLMAADRYSYMAMLGSVVVAAAFFCRLWRMSSGSRPGAIGITAVALGALLGLTAMTRIQCRTWLNPETLWEHALYHGGSSSQLVQFHLGQVRYTQAKYDAAAAHFTAAVRLGTQFAAKAHNNLGTVLFIQGKYEEAVAHFTEALRLDPGYGDAHRNLATILSRRGKYAEAQAHYAEVARLNPEDDKAHSNLGKVLSKREKYEEAVAHFNEVLRLNPGSVDGHFSLGLVLSRLGNYEAAAVQFAEAIRLEPGDPKAYNASAMLMAACPESKFRDGKRAVQFATRACELTKWKNPIILDTLAAAQAEAGDFGAAVTSQKRTMELLTDERQKDDYRSRLELYQAKKPYRQVSARPRPN